MPQSKVNVYIAMATYMYIFLIPLNDKIESGILSASYSYVNLSNSTIECETTAN